jgi:hypothetical protein
MHRGASSGLELHDCATLTLGSSPPCNSSDSSGAIGAGSEETFPHRLLKSRVPPSSVCI